jgi:adenylate kinase
VCVRARAEVCVAVPREIIWLGGAPGSGKGTNSPFVAKARGLAQEPIVLSKLLTAPEFKPIIERGELVSDRQVLKLLMEQLLESRNSPGTIIDGFPRTKLQVDFIRQLRDEMTQLHNEFKDIAHPRPRFRVVCLFVNEQVSVQRQIARGREAQQHNEQVRSTGQGQLVEVRPDVDPSVARARYAVFREHYDVLRKMSELFPFSLIDASQPLEQVRSSILNQLRHQSELDLSEATFEALQCITPAEMLIKNARSHLVQRLDHYAMDHKELFGTVIAAVRTEFMPCISRQAFSGWATIRTRNPLFADELCVSMVLDVLSERGYRVMFERESEHVASALHGESIVNVEQTHYVFQVIFQQTRLAHV